MTPKRLILVIAAVSMAFLAAPRPAEACGFWSLEDVARDARVRFDISTVRDAPKGKKGRYILRLVEDKNGELRAERGGKRLYAIDGAEVKRRNKVVGTIDGETVTFGERTFEIRIGANTQTKRRSVHKYWVEVLEADKTIAEGAAMALCLGNRRNRTVSDEMAEIRTRTIYYLAWRQR